MSLGRPVYPRKWEGPAFLFGPMVGRVVGLAPATIQRLSQDYATTDGRAGLRRAMKGRRHFWGHDVLRFMQRRAAEQYVRAIFKAIRLFAARKRVALKPIRFNFYCDQAQADHHVIYRFHAHAFHGAWAGKDAVCVVPEIALLPPATAAGIILHEVGHIMADDRVADSAEPAADEWVRSRLGLEILYSPKGTMQYLSRHDMAKLGL